MTEETKKKLRDKGVYDGVDLNIDKVKALYLSGLSCRKVANELGVSASLIINKVKELGITRTQSEAQKNRFASSN